MTKKIRVCVSLDPFVYKKMMYEVNSIFNKKTKSDYINSLIDSNTKILELLDLVRK